MRMNSCVSYKEALPPEKHRAMELFLRRLTKISQISKETGDKLCVECFIKEYRKLISGRCHGMWIQTTAEERQNINDRHKLGESIRDIAQDKERAESTIKRIIDKRR